MSLPEKHVFRHIDPDAACPVDGLPAWAHDPAQAVMHEWRLSTPDSLDAAWAEAEAGLPETSVLSLEGPAEYHPRSYKAKAFKWGQDGDCSDYGYGPTPAAALRALAAELRKRPATSDKQPLI
jgi:hypothetical protein